jgi:hypothetical protein
MCQCAKVSRRKGVPAVGCYLFTLCNSRCTGNRNRAENECVNRCGKMQQRGFAILSPANSAIPSNELSPSRWNTNRSEVGSRAGCMPRLTRPVFQLAERTAEKVGLGARSCRGPVWPGRLAALGALGACPGHNSTQLYCTPPRLTHATVPTSIRYVEFPRARLGTNHQTQSPFIGSDLLKYFCQLCRPALDIDLPALDIWRPTLAASWRVAAFGLPQRRNVPASTESVGRSIADSIYVSDLARISRLFPARVYSAACPA